MTMNEDEQEVVIDIDAWPRRGVHWEVFEADGHNTAEGEPGTCFEIERIDEPDAGPECEFSDDGDGRDCGHEECPGCNPSDPVMWPDGPFFAFDDEAAGFVLTTASRPPADCPVDVIAECRAAVREIVRTWPKPEPKRKRKVA